jgi:hypothetical protein
MATPDSPNVSPKRRVRTVARRAERICVTLASYFPLAFVYSLTTWAVWVEAGVGFTPTKNKWLGALPVEFSWSCITLTLLPLLSRLAELSTRDTVIYTTEYIVYCRRLYRSRLAPRIL